jgi:glucosamine 6-phosphate synthetase-like amidotransferase/phosphosugar isomerase protein
MKLENWKLNLPIPVPGMGCGVLGLTLAHVSVNLGKYASSLLKALEYRGYDSTGAAFQAEDKKVTLLKDVGAPSTLVETLGITTQRGSIFCGQVRWATFGAVDRANSQPHVVRCKRFLYGAHNGNITNTRELKQFLLSEGHDVLSDNDGEMLVHTIEHYFDIELNKHPANRQFEREIRRRAMHAAIINANRRTVGSFAAVITDPETELQYAIKAGSSLYFGVGTLEDAPFALASSDLTAILRYTKNLVKLTEGEFVEYDARHYQIYAYKNLVFKRPGEPDLVFDPGDAINREPSRSKLRAEDTELLPQYHYFMEQEIHAETESTGKLVKIFLGGSNTGRRMITMLQKASLIDPMKQLCADIQKSNHLDEQQKLFDDFIASPLSEKFYEKVQSDYTSIWDVLTLEDFDRKYFFSSDKNSFLDLIGPHFDKKRMLTAKALDSIVEKLDILDFDKRIEDFVKLITNTVRNNRNIYTVACGTSFHATKLAAVFFNQIAGIEIVPILPGDFRGEYSKCIKDNDVIIGVSQSGETKDLVDIFNDIDAMNLEVKKIVLVNNMNSTLGQEKSDVSVPIYCGPEIAVPATKSFINQLTLFYYLAIKTAELRWEEMKSAQADPDELKKLRKEIDRRYKTLLDIPPLIKETIDTTADSIENVAQKIYMEPSMHILATKLTGVAKEGALKIRETVLNHAEGSEASEFKHGPNTILGRNTVFGIKSIKEMIHQFNLSMDEIDRMAPDYDVDPTEVREIYKAISSFIFNRTFPFHLSSNATRLFKYYVSHHDFFAALYRNYPLIYVTGPEDRDINLTISQINTHKIRGADTFIIAEENDRLSENACAVPRNGQYYGHGYIVLPRTGDTLMTAFSATIVLQLLALRMSIKKMAYLDKLGVTEHGVHPDVPKNVSKSITVD